MTELKIFNNPEFGEIRTVEVAGEPWLVGKDVALALGYSDTSDALKKHVDPEDKLTRRFADSGQNREMYIINESGLYSLVLSSKLPGAKKFKRWVTSEVLPSIRKTGHYTAKPMTEYQQMMAETRRRNARVQSARILTQLAKQYHGTTYEQVLNAHATKELTGEYLLPLPQLEAKTYSAEEIGKILGISSNKVGTLANQNELKNDEYGQWFKDKAKWSNKEVPSFRYYENVIPILRGILDREKY
jgi:hypothetical protein|nr:MAG TPA_asm: repressor domain protein [Bacteriophage sp.]